MKPATRSCNTEGPLYQSLAEFRHQLRLFLAASEEAAHKAGLHPQQHQLLLAIVGAGDGQTPSIAYVAERLGLKHNTVVELVDRSEQQGLLQRRSDPKDGRRVRVEATARGRRLLARLSQFHFQELNLRAPQLIAALQNVLRNGPENARTRRPRKTFEAPTHA